MKMRLGIKSWPWRRSSADRSRRPRGPRAAHGHERQQARTAGEPRRHRVAQAHGRRRAAPRHPEYPGSRQPAAAAGGGTASQPDIANGSKPKRHYTVTPAVVAAHKANAQRSTGAKSVAGNEAGSRNAVAHGLTAIKTSI